MNTPDSRYTMAPRTLREDSTMTNARHLVTLVLLAVIHATVVAQAAPIRLGPLLPYTGVLSVQGIDTTNGLELYLAKIGGKAGGREIQILKEDDEAKPDVGLTKIKKLVERDHVDFLVGPVVFTRVLTSPPQASPSIFRVAETTDQSNDPMGAWVWGWWNKK